MSLAIELLVLIVAAALSALGGYTFKNNQCRVERQAAVIDASRRATEQANAIAAQDNELVGYVEKTRVERRTVYATLEKERIRYVETHPDAARCGLDPDGLRIWNAANAGVLPADLKDAHGGAGEIAAGDRREPAGIDGKPPNGG